jgi:hypothetical protein
MTDQKKIDNREPIVVRPGDNRGPTLAGEEHKVGLRDQNCPTVSEMD